MTQIYHYNEQGLFSHATEARLDPLEEAARLKRAKEPDAVAEDPIPLVPSNATLIQPPATGKNEVAKFVDGAWVKVVDYRDNKYYTPDGGQVEINDVDISPPVDAIALTEADALIQEDGTWRIRTDDDDLNDAKQNKILMLSVEVTKAINNGFESDALGSTHKYDSEQHNIDWNQAVVVSGKSQPITCDDKQANPDSKQPRIHADTESKQVLEDGMAALLAHKTKFITLRAQVLTAADEAAVNAIVW